MSSWPTLKMWSEFAVMLTLELLFLFAVAKLISLRLRCAQWQRALWQITLVAMLLMFIGELNGVRGLLPRRTPKPVTVTPSRSITVTIKEPEIQPVLALTMDESAGKFSSPTRPKESPNSRWQRSVAWPGILMLTIAAGLWIRVLAAHLLTFTFHGASRRWNDTDLNDLLQRIASLLKVGRKITLARSLKTRAPFTFGVWRPVIVLPHLFKDTFTPAQREAVLAHEVAHVAGFDSAWRTFSPVLCASLWWNPFAWLAKRELDRANELVADEASLVLADGPIHLADCLVLCAAAPRTKLFATWLGMDGVNFRSTLGRRVARLLHLRTRPTPRYDVPGLLRFVTLPLCIAALWTGMSLFTPASAQRGTWNDSILGSAVAAATAKFPEAVKLNQSNSTTTNAVERVQQERIEARGRNFKREVRDWPTSPERLRLEEKLRTIRLQKWGPIDGLPLSEVIRTLTEQAQRSDPATEGVNFILDPGIQDVAALEQHLKEQHRRLESGSIMPLEVKLAEAELTKARDMGGRIRLGSQLTDLTLEQVLNVLTTVADRKIKYTIEDYGVVISMKDEEPLSLHTRFYRVTATKLREKLGITSGTSGVSEANESVIPAFRNLMSGAGVELSAPGKAVFWSDRKEIVMVRATLEDLDAIEKKLELAPTNTASVFPIGGEATDTSPLRTRFFRIDPSTLQQRLQSIVALDFKGSKTNQPLSRLPIETERVIRRTNSDGSISYLSEPAASDHILAAMQSFFHSAGVDLSAAGKAVFYNDRLGVLMVKGESDS